MNEQLQGKLVEILSGIQSATKAAGDFTLAQLPDIAQSYVLYGRTISTVQLVMWLAAFSACLYVVLAHGFFSKTPNDKIGGHDIGWPASRVFAAIGGCFGGALSFFVLSAVTSNAALVWLAPKVWLLKELASLIK